MSELDPRVVNAVEHLQRAALELIAAMRNALDVAEDMVGDPTSLQTLVQGALMVTQNLVTTSPPDAAEPVERVERIHVD